MKNLSVLFLAFALFGSKAFSQQDSSVTAQRFLPLQVTNLDASVLNKNVQLVWAVNNNEEVRTFEIERAEEKGAYKKVGSKLSSGRAGQAEYEFVDALPRKNLTLSYRIRLITKDGADVYSAVQITRIGDDGLQCKLKQNPVRNRIEVEVIAATAATVVASVYTAYGQKAATETAKLSAGANHLSFSTQSLLPGIHRLVLETGNERALLSFVKE